MNQPKIFLSYSHRSSEDREWIQELAKHLSARELSPWLDQWSVKPGDRLSETLAEGLRTSDVLVFLVSPESLGSANLFFELGVALSMGKKIIPIVSRDIRPGELPSPLRERAYLVKTTPEEAAEKVAQALAVAA